MSLRLALVILSIFFLNCSKIASYPIASFDLPTSSEQSQDDKSTSDTLPCTCTTGECCDGCYLSAENTLCRAALDPECDTPEYCDGISSECPADNRSNNYSLCSSGYCIDGKCNACDSSPPPDALICLDFDNDKYVESCSDSSQEIYTCDDTDTYDPPRIDSNGKCNSALSFLGKSYIVIKDSDFSTEVKAIDFFVKVDTLPESSLLFSGIFSKDARGPQDGHLALFFTSTQRFVIRHQTTNDSTANGDIYLCSDSIIKLGTWYHITINLAPEELYINGVKQIQATDNIILQDGSWTATCNNKTSTQLLLNDGNPWVIGGFSGNIDVGLEPAPDRLFKGKIDRFYLYSTRR